MNNSIENKTVLLIDKDEAFLQRVSGYLNDLKYNVVSAVNSRDGLDFYIKKKPDVVLVDVNISEVNGFDVLKYISENDVGIPLIVLSSGSYVDFLKALKSGGWNYIKKPVYDLNIIQEIIDKSVRLSRLIRLANDSCVELIQ